MFLPPPTKFREGSVFSRVCHSVHKGCHGTITHDTLDLTKQEPTPPPPPLPPALALAPHPTCSDLFNLDLPVEGLLFPDMFKVVHYESYTPGKRTVGSLRECFIFSCSFCHDLHVPSAVYVRWMFSHWLYVVLRWPHHRDEQLMILPPVNYRSTGAHGSSER